MQRYFLCISLLISFLLLSCPLIDPPNSTLEPTSEPTIAPTPSPEPTPVIYSSITNTTGSVDFDLHLVSAGNYYVGPNPPGTNNVTITKSFWIAKTEVTYELWYEVRNWAENTADPVYDFANSGRAGQDGSDGVVPGADRFEPTGNINWRDCMIWCNALSEKQSLTPVYYTDSGFTVPIRSVTNTMSINTMAGAQDNPYTNWNADGYRLPTDAEWEIAARGAQIAVAGGTYGTTYAGSNTISNVAWYSDNSGGDTHPVGTKAANELGLFDMNGNADEWIWDWYKSSPYPSGEADPIGAASGGARLARGGFYTNQDYVSNVYFRNSSNPWLHFTSYSFRFIRIEL